MLRRPQRERPSSNPSHILDTPGDSRHDPDHRGIPRKQRLNKLTRKPRTGKEVSPRGILIQLLPPQRPPQSRTNNPNLVHLRQCLRPRQHINLALMGIRRQSPHSDRSDISLVKQSHADTTVGAPNDIAGPDLRRPPEGVGREGARTEVCPLQTGLFESHFHGSVQHADGVVGIGGGARRQEDDPPNAPPKSRDDARSQCRGMKRPHQVHGRDALQSAVIHDEIVDPARISLHCGRQSPGGPAQSPDRAVGQQLRHHVATNGPGGAGNKEHAPTMTGQSQKTGMETRKMTETVTDSALRPSKRHRDHTARAPPAARTRTTRAPGPAATG